MNSNKLIRQWIRDLSRNLKTVADPFRSPEQKRYLKSPYKFYGVRKPFIDRIALQFKRQNVDISPALLDGLINSLWKSDYHEEKSLAIALLRHFSQKWHTGTLNLVDHIVGEVTGWDHLDELAIHVLGPLIHKGHAPISYLETCVDNSNVWKRRAALIAQISYLRKGEGDIALQFNLCLKHLHEKEFFIRKAIGWSLRELSKKKPEEVFEFLKTHKMQISSVTFREASRNLPVQFKSQLK